MTDAELLQHYIRCKRIIHGAERSPGHHRLLKLGFIEEYPVSIKNLLITATAAGRHWHGPLSAFRVRRARVAGYVASAGDGRHTSSSAITVTELARPLGSMPLVSSCRPCAGVRVRRRKRGSVPTGLEPNWLRSGIGQLSKREAKATPLPFRDLLISISRTATAPILEAAE